MKTFGFALVGMLFWGLAPVLGKLGLTKVSPALGLTIRSFTVSLFLLGWLLMSGKAGELSRVDARTWAFVAAEGVLASLLGHLAYYYALKFGEASRVTPVMAAFPLVTVALGIIFLGEKLTLAKIGGAAMVVVGVLLIRG
mgnify:CR=1 FL=1